MTYEKMRDKESDKYKYGFFNPTGLTPPLTSPLDIEAHFKSGADWFRDKLLAAMEKSRKKELTLGYGSKVIHFELHRENLRHELLKELGLV